MSITDELRQFADEWDWLDYRADKSARRIRTIADRIDAEHERAVRYERCAFWHDASDSELAKYGLLRALIDADGEPIRIGDVLTDDAEFKSEGVVERLMLDKGGWFVGFGGGWTEATLHEWHHYHTPTVEDVLREFAGECLTYATCVEDHEVTDAIERFAAKLRLAGDAK